MRAEYFALFKQIYCFITRLFDRRPTLGANVAYRRRDDRRHLATFGDIGNFALQTLGDGGRHWAVLGHIKRYDFGCLWLRIIYIYI